MSRSMIPRKKCFYVYALLDERKPGPVRYGRWVFKFEPFYIGKGVDDRHSFHLKVLNGWTSDTNNKHKINKIKKIHREGFKTLTRFIRTDLTERAAFDLEIRLIASIGRQCEQGPLTNQTAGGDGLKAPSTKTRRKMSKSAALAATRKTPEEKLQERNRRSASLKRSWALRTQTEVDLMAERMRKTCEAKSERQKAVIRAKRSASMVAAHARMTPKQKRARSKKMLAANAARTPKQRKEISLKISETVQKRWAEGAYKVARK